MKLGKPSLVITALLVATITSVIVLSYIASDNSMLLLDLSPNLFSEKLRRHPNTSEVLSKLTAEGMQLVDNDGGLLKLSSRAEKNKALFDHWNRKKYGDPLLARSRGDNDRADLENYEFAEGMEHWVPDWYEKTDMNDVLTRRMQNIVKLCRSFQGRRNEWKNEIWHLVEQTASLKYCSHAKAGCTFWKHVVRALTDQKMAVLRNSTTSILFTTIRNPWHRLVSTYIQKAAAMTVEMQKICPFKLQKRPTFRIYVRDCVLANWGDGIHNIHTMPALDRCNICDREFDYAVAVENMMAESSYLLSTLGLDNADEFLLTVRKSTIRKNEARQISKNYQDYYDSLDVEDIKQLQDLYALDIYALQYPHSPFVDFKNA